MAEPDANQKYLTRIVIGLALLGFVFLCNYAGASLWSVLILVVALLAFQEFRNLCNRMGVFILASWINFFIVLFVLMPLLVARRYTPELVFTYQLCLIVAAYVIIFPRILLKETFTKFDDVTTSLWAVFHLGLLPSFFTWIRIMDKGFYFTLIIILASAANDTGSLLFGKLFGKTKLAPHISPGKTIAGSLGGIFCASWAFWGFCSLWGIKLNPDFWDSKIEFLSNNLMNFSPEIFSIAVFIALGALYAIVGQIGDLLVSALKRAAGVKDSGHLLMSHGGVLDRVDSHFFAVWFAFFVFAYLVR